MTAEPGVPDRTHLKRIYARIDDLNARVSRLERNLYIGTGGVGALVVFNLVTNLAQLTGR